MKRTKNKQQKSVNMIKEMPEDINLKQLWEATQAMKKLNKTLNFEHPAIQLRKAS